MRRRAALAAVLAAIVAPMPHQAGATPPEPLGHEGRWTTDARGRVVVLHGAAVVVGGAFGDPAKPERTAEQEGFARADAKLLARHGFNVVRLGMFYRGFEPTLGRFDDAYLESFVRTQELLAGEGIFTVLDFHQDQLAPEYSGRGFPAWFLQDDDLPNTRASFPGGYFGNPALNRAYDHLWANDPAVDGTGLIDHFAAGWRRVAARFAEQPLVAGYDIFNEPWPGSAYPTCANPAGCPPGGFDQTQLTAFSNRIIAAIRGADPHRIVYYEPNLMFDVGAETGHGKVDDRNAGMSFHNYCLGAAPGLPAVPDPLGLCEGVGETLVFENAEEHSRATGATLLMTEYGDSENSAIHARVAKLADRFMVGWTVWAYMGSTGQIKRDNSKPPREDNLRADTLAAVVRPYPRVVAGTPERWEFDRDAKRFEARWSTTLPNGERTRGMASEVFVPSLHFGSGYRVTLAGAELRTSEDRQLLRIRACQGAGRVSIVVTDEAPRPTPTCRRDGRGIERGRCARRLVGGPAGERLRGTRFGDRISGRGGRDRIGSLAGRDCLRGGRGRDSLSGGPGRDRLRGGRGGDWISARDATRERIDCGGGDDRARVDRRDRARRCEVVRRPS